MAQEAVRYVEGLLVDRQIAERRLAVASAKRRYLRPSQAIREQIKVLQSIPPANILGPDNQYAHQQAIRHLTATADWLDSEAYRPEPLLRGGAAWRREW